MKKILCLTFVFLLAAGSAFASDPAVLAAGGGYKKMVNALAKAYTAETGNSLQLVYGNMGRVTAQAKNSGAVDLVIGADFFLTRAQLDFSEEMKLGRGKLVLAWSKSFKGGINPVDMLESAAAKRVATPDPHKAIYGRAAAQYLKHTGLDTRVGDRLVEVAAIPQVFSYLSLNEVDLGFMNLTHTLNVLDSLGGYVVIPDETYKPIFIMAGQLANASHPKQAQEFYRFLKTDKAQKIIRTNGL